MAWPSSTKAGTTNVDSGSDKPSLARSDIKQNIDNVNSIIDEFNISSPSDGDLLQYSSSSGQWEQVASSSIGNQLSIARFSTSSNTTNDTLVSGTDYTYRRTISSGNTIDPSGFISFDATNTIMTLGAGTYIFTAFAITEEQEVGAYFVNESDDSNLASVYYGTEIGTTGDNVSLVNQGFVLTSETDVSIRQTSSSSSFRNASISIILFKV